VSTKHPDQEALAPNDGDVGFALEHARDNGTDTLVRRGRAQASLHHFLGSHGRRGDT
jgi:hypothetical protein